MKRWPTQPLGDLLVALESGSRPKGGVGEIADGIPSVSGEHIDRDGRFYWETPKHVTRAFYHGMKRGRIKCGDILIVKDGATTGKTAVVRESFPFSEAAINEHVFLLRTDAAKANPVFVGYFLFSANGQQQILSNYRGAAIGGIAQDFVRSVHIPLPPLAEQQRIVRLLDEADELRKLRAQADTRTSQLIPALFHEMFLNTKMRDIVWPKVTLSELCSRVVDCPHSTPAYSARETPFHCVRSSDIQGGKFDWSSTKTVERDEYEERIAQLEPQAGDVVFCREGARLGNAAVIPNDRRVCLGQRMMLFRLNPSISTPYFLCSLILSQPIQNKIWTLVGGSASPHLNVRDIKDFLTDLPPLALQQEFDRRVNEIRAFEAAQTASRRRTEDLFQSMLHRAFNGEL